MISLDSFYRACKQATDREPNDEQKKALKAPPGQPLFIVAGPGTGKTACLTLRTLKLILVDEVPPQSILATTFTKKAAAELRSRILSWGFRLVEVLGTDPNVSRKTRDRMQHIDINQVLTGTIDSICEQLLRDHREAGALPPVLVDEFVTKTLFLREAFLAEGRYKDSTLDSFLGDLHGGSYGFNLGRKAELALDFWERRFHDQVDWESFIKGGPKAERQAREKLNEVISAYENSISTRNLVDFSLLEQEVLRKLRTGELEIFRSQLRAVLVDEYQDTNLLQEAVYFELAKACEGNLSVVGDDDQSLFRFRGATVDLFREFSDRYARTFRRTPQPVFLKTNYRSSKSILWFVNSYVRLDEGYQAVRVSQKPKLIWGPKAIDGVPVIGMFRETTKDLAKDLAAFVHQIFRGKGYRVSDSTRIHAHKEGGDVGDCALLCSSPAEYNASGNPRLPLLLRQELKSLRPTIEVFNPRGEDLTDIEIIKLLGGLLLECLDPGGEVQDEISWLSDSIKSVFDDWRDRALDFLEKGSPPKGLKAFARGWAERNPGRKGYVWPRSVPILDLVYALTHFFPELHDDPEGEIYLEVFARQVSACEAVGKFSGRVVTDPNNEGLSKASVKELLVDFLGPTASGTIKVNEELMEAFPRDRLSILSIHQSKGLEFPLTIVDAGSDFKGNQSAHAFKRFPQKGGLPHKLEELLRPYTDLGKPIRTQVDRAFDDLYRQFFVAYSRAQDVLLLVGLRKSLPEFNVLNVATGWSRKGSNTWRNKLPLLMI